MVPTHRRPTRIVEGTTLVVVEVGVREEVIWKEEEKAG